LGLTSMLPSEARPVLVQMNQMVQQAKSAGASVDLSKPLQPPMVVGLLDHARLGYELQWDNANLSRFAIPAPAYRSSENSVVAVRFGDGWQVACLFPYPGAQVTCREVITYTSEE
jgi:hypothetical protein